MQKPKPKGKDHVLDEQQIKEIYNQCKNFKEQILIKGLINTGMRISEFIHIKKNWIDNNYTFITIPEKTTCNCTDCKEPLIINERKKNPLTGVFEKTGKKIIKRPAGYWMPKTKNGSRKVYILPEIKDLLKEYFKHNDIMLSLVPNRVLAWDIVNNVGERAGIKMFPHSLRATYATKLVEEGIDPYRLTNMMGWSSMAPAISYVKNRESDIIDFFENKYDKKEV